MRTYCIFSAHYLPHLGGVERYTYNLALHLTAKGNKVIVVTSNTYSLADVEVVEGIKIYRLPCVNLLDGRFPIVKMSRKFLNINKKLYDENIDFVIVNTRFYIHSLYGVRFSKKINVKGIIIEHGTDHFTVNNPFLDKLGHLYEHIITGLIKVYEAPLYGVSTACNNWLKHFKIKAEGVLHNAVNLKEISKITENPPTHYRSKYNIKETDIVICFSGRLIKEKGITKLFEALNILKKSENSVYLFVAGDGNLMEYLKEIVSFAPTNIILLGQIDFPHIISLYNQSDIFCLPTDFAEGFPTTVIEAAACNCYCITTTRGGSMELIMDDSYGKIIHDNTPENIAEAIKNAITNNSYRLAAAEKAHKRAIENFNWEVVTEKVVEVFELK